MEPQLQLAEHGGAGTAPGEEARLSEVFGALADPVRRAILVGLDGRDLLVSEVAAPFDISLQAVSRHIQVLVRTGLVRKRQRRQVDAQRGATSFGAAAV